MRALQAASVGESLAAWNLKIDTSALF